VDNLLPDEEEIGVDLAERCLFYLGAFDEVTGTVISLRSMLLVQYFLKTMKIPYVLSASEPTPALDHPVCNKLGRLLDLERFCPMPPRVDLAPDGSHFGPKTVELLAEALVAHPQLQSL
jgi:hypothetical protein